MIVSSSYRLFFHRSIIFLIVSKTASFVYHLKLLNATQNEEMIFLIKIVELNFRVILRRCHFSRHHFKLEKFSSHDRA